MSASAREQVQAEDGPDEEQRVLRRDRVADQQAGEAEQRRARRSVALADHQREGREAEHRGEDMGEQEGRQRQRERAEAEEHRRGRPVARLVALGDAPDEQQQDEPGQDVPPQPDEVDHLVVSGLGLRVPRPGVGIQAVEDVVPGQREEREPRRAGRVPVALVEDLVSGVVLVGIDRRPAVVERAQQVVVRGLVPAEALDDRREGEPHEHDRREREPPRSAAPGANRRRARRAGARASAAGGGRDVVAPGEQRPSAHRCRGSISKMVSGPSWKRVTGRPLIDFTAAAAGSGGS